MDLIELQDYGDYGVELQDGIGNSCGYDDNMHNNVADACGIVGNACHSAGNVRNNTGNRFDNSCKGIYKSCQCMHE